MMQMVDTCLMRLSRVLIVFIACGSAPLPETKLLAADAKADLRSQVEGLIRQLDSGSLVDRSRAERQLLEIGPEALRYLPPPDLIENVSAREALLRLRPLLERRAAQESSAASRVSLTGERTVADLVGEITRQSRNRLSIVTAAEEASKKTVTVDWQKKPFWECMEDLCQKSGLEWQWLRDDSSIQIIPASEQKPRPIQIQILGPIRIAVEKAESKEVFGDPTRRLLRVTGHIAIEPRLRPLFFMMAAADFQAFVDQQAIPSINPEAKFEFPVSDAGHEISFQWDFAHAADLSVELISIKGRMNCQIAAATERVVFDQKSLTPGTIRRRGGVTVKLRRVVVEAQPNDRLNSEIGIVVTYDTGIRIFESHRSWMYHNAVYLETKTGVRTAFTDFETTQQNDGSIAVDYHWSDLELPASQYLFVYEAPSLFIDIPIDIDLKELTVKKVL